MTKLMKASAAVVCSGALAIGGSGVALAESADNATPSGWHQLCGNVYTGADWVETGPPPAGAQGVENVEVLGTLRYSNGQPTGSTYRATTDAEGRYCLQGNLGMVAIVLAGGSVLLEAGGAEPNTWTTDGIFEEDFAEHQYGLMPSANEFHHVVE